MNKLFSDRIVPSTVVVHVVVLSILTLVTAAVFVHIFTTIVFRRIVVDTRMRNMNSAIKNENDSGTIDEELFIDLNRIGTDELREQSTFLEQNISASELRTRQSTAFWTMIKNLPETCKTYLITGGEQKIFVKYHDHGPDHPNQTFMILCSPSAVSVDRMNKSAIKLADKMGCRGIVLFDYRPNGRSSGIVAPSITTLYEDAYAVLKWLMDEKNINPNNIIITGMSLGGLQAVRLARRNKDKGINKLLLINTFCSFSCLLSSASRVLGGLYRMTGVSLYFPDFTHEVRGLETDKIAIISTSEDALIPLKCTEQLIEASSTNLLLNDNMNILHVRIPGTHSKIPVDYSSMKKIRDFFDMTEIHNSEFESTEDLVLAIDT